MHGFKTYNKRNIKYIEQVDSNDWRIKVYSITENSTIQTEKLARDATKMLMSYLPQPAVTEDRYGVGFLITHYTETTNWFLLNWWEDENVVHHKIFSSSSSHNNRITQITDQSIMACIYELEIYNFERIAWIDTVLSGSKDMGFEQYLLAQPSVDEQQ